MIIAASLLQRYGAVVGLALMVQLPGCEASQLVAPASAPTPVPAGSMAQNGCVASLLANLPATQQGSGIYLFDASCADLFGAEFTSAGSLGNLGSVGAHALTYLPTDYGIAEWCFRSYSDGGYPNNPADGVCFAANPPAGMSTTVPLYIYSSPIPNTTYRQVRSFVQQRLRTGVPFRLRSRAAAMGDRG